MRTSESHPLRIDAVAAPGGGRIGLTICPGKVQADSMTGPWDRDLNADLAVARRFGAAAVVTLMEDEELAWVQVPVDRLGPAVRALGMEWLHLPIVDVSVPDEAFEVRWLWAGARLREHLRRGRSVVIHCRGGLGRSGEIAARLLVELGIPPREAIDAVRDARPGAIETSEQEDHVLAASVADPELERVAGCLLAGAIGDALGAPIEFFDLEDIRARHGPEGVRDLAPMDGRVGLVTDDTQMALFTGEGLVLGLHAAGADGNVLAESVWRAYHRWLATQDPGHRVPPAGWLFDRPEMHGWRAPGGTCLGALRTGRMGTPEEPLNESKGCGGLMRVAPVGLIAPRLGSLDEVFDLGAATAAATHGHPSGYLSAGVGAVLVARLVAGIPLEETLDEATAILIRRPGHEETFAALQAARTMTSPTPEDLESLGGAWVGEEALAISVCAALAADDLEEALLLAVNHGGDSDSTGAIAGNLMGAALGAGAIPERWASRVELGDTVLEMALKLAEMRGR